MKKIIILLFSLVLFLPNSSVAFAQGEDYGIDWDEISQQLTPLDIITFPTPVLSTGEHGERQTYLEQGDRAPWPGALLNPAAVAYIISEYQSSFARGQATLQHQRELDWARLRLEVGQLRLQLSFDRRQADLVIDNQQEEILRLQNIHTEYIAEQNGGFWNTDFGQVLQWGLVIVGSAAVGLVLGMAVSGLN